jgi:muramoyltetrapeptide carboxypeptidase LdcA involved in peptidoglycan recycling
MAAQSNEVAANNWWDDVSIQPVNSDDNSNTKIYDRIEIKGEKVVEDQKYGDSLPVDTSQFSPLVFFPHYKISDYFKDLNNFRKQVNPLGQKGCFYFKVFFNFDMGYGLLGKEESPNTALYYLNSIKGLPMYKSELIHNRIKALKKFINALKVMSIDTPWFFKELGNLNNLNDMLINDDDFGTESFFNIICNYESTDMRLGTLFNLYKFACYNTLRNKEILPPNLRKFDVSILFMHVPLKDYHTEFSYTGGKFNEKELNMNYSNDLNNIMSVKMLTFQNCEFDVKSMTEMSDSASNENMFELGNNTLKINYGRVYEHRINEFEGLGFGPDGFIFDLNENENEKFNNKRLETIANELKNILDQQLTEIDDTEALSKHLGSEYYNEKLDKMRRFTFNPDNIYMNFTNVRSHYFLSKIRNMKEGNNYTGNLFGLFDFGKIENPRGNAKVNLENVKEKINNTLHPSEEIVTYDEEFDPNKLTDSEYSDTLALTLDAKDKHLGTRYYKGKIYELKNNRVTTEPLDQENNGLLYSYNLDALNKQLGTKYYDEKIDEWKNNNTTVEPLDSKSTLYEYNLDALNKRLGSYYYDDKIYEWKHNNETIEALSETYNSYLYSNRLDASSKRIRTEYYDAKIDEWKNNKTTIEPLNQENNGLLYSYNLDALNKQIGTQYYDEKIDEWKNNKTTIEPLNSKSTLYEYSLDALNKQLGTDYYDDKIDNLKSNKSSATDDKDNVSSKQLGTEYYDAKIDNLKSNKSTGKDDPHNVSSKQVGTKYYDEKIDELKNNKHVIEPLDENASLYTYGLDALNKQLGTQYYDEKIDEWKNNHTTVEAIDRNSELYSYSADSLDKQVYTPYYKKKIRKLKSNKSNVNDNLGNISNKKVRTDYYNEKLNKLKNPQV